MKKTVTIIAVISFFVFVNIFLYATLTSRLGNNYSCVSQTKMIDVARYLPFEETSDLAKTGSSLHFSNADDLPVLDGAAALVPVYASIIDSVYPEGSVTYEGGSFSDDNKYGENFAEDSVMKYQNTIRGFDALLDGSVDLFFTAHPSENQMKTASEKGIEIELLPVGLEAFVFFVNKNNPVESLTIDEIRAIYRGNITNWKELGGPNRTINPLLRIKNSGSQTMMEKFMENDMIKSRSIFAVFGASIGYSFRYYLSGMVTNDNVKMLSVNGVYPDETNIQNGLYPLTSSFYVAYRKDTPNPNVKKLVDWILSQEGQRLIEGCGYVAINSR